jgi:hypothetical protein
VLKEARALGKSMTKMFVKEEPPVAKVIDFEYLRTALKITQNESNQWSTFSQPEYFNIINATLNI